MRKSKNKTDCKKGWEAFLYFAKKYSKILLKTLYFFNIYDNIYLQREIRKKQRGKQDD